MKSNYPIPAIMAHLPQDERGFPVPYFVPIINGKPDFRYQDAKKRSACLKHGLCAVCGKKLHDKSYWFICGPMGLINKIHSDAPTHEDCARFSLNVCPHLVFGKAQRRSEESENTNPHLVRNHPENIFLVKADKYGTLTQGGHLYITFRPRYNEHYTYENSKLIFKSKSQ